jgi:hypothetical protein
MFHQYKTMSSRNHCFITFAKTSMSKDDASRAVQSIGATHGIIALEKHEDGSPHIHVAAWGKFRQDRATRKLHQEIPVGAHCDLHYAHPPKPTKAKSCVKQRGAGWPFGDMVTYLVDPAKQKYLDPDPTFFGSNADGSDISSVDELLDVTAHNVNWLDKMDKLKLDDAPIKSVIRTIAEDMDDHHNSHWYRICIDYYRSLQSLAPRLVPVDQKPREWQEAVAAWAMTPIPSDGNNNGIGMWIRLPPGSGKSWVGDWLHDYYNGNVFYPGMRPHGDYDCLSFMGYNNEPVILMNDLAPSDVRQDGETKSQWKRSILDMLKRICDNTPLCFQFGGHTNKVYIKARIIVTSNFALPKGRSPDDTEAIRRRYRVLDNRTAAKAELAKPTLPVAEPDLSLDGASSAEFGDPSDV